MISLMQKILLIQGNGDYDTAKEWVKAEANISDQLQHDLDRLNASNIPVDIIFEQGADVLGLK